MMELLVEATELMCLTSNGLMLESLVDVMLFMEIHVVFSMVDKFRSSVKLQQPFLDNLLKVMKNNAHHSLFLRLLLLIQLL